MGTIMKKLVYFLLLGVISCTFLSFNSLTPEFERVRYSLDQEAWKFKKADVKNGQKIALNDADWLDITIPHDFNGGIDGVNNDVFKGRFNFALDPDERMMYKGPGWYRMQFNVDTKYKGKRIFIEFEAVSLEATVWVNEKMAGHHQGGYTAFTLDVTDYIKFGKTNVLAVKADNSNNPAIAPWMADEKKPFPYSFDYAIYGGIYRDVWLTITDDVKIETVLNTPICGGQAAAVLNIDTRVKNYSDNEKIVILSSEVYNPKGELVTTLTRKKTIAAGEMLTIQQSETSIGDLYYWSPDKPQIYKVKSTLSYDGKEVDQFESVFGFRYYTLANHQPFMLNGKQLLIRGINRHQDMEGCGYALSNEQHRSDAQLLKDAGFNFVRHAHYPCDQEFAKSAMELGLMLWLEIPLTGSTSEDPLFGQNCKSQLTEMIEQYYNNPAVILWGIGNESDRSGGGEAVSNALYSDLIKEANALDQNRIATGCNYKFKSNQDLTNVYAPQDWSGWYHGSMSEYKPKEIIGEYGSDIDVNIRTNETFDIHTNYSAAGKPKFWSQEYGAFLHEYKVSIGEAYKDSFPGHFAWVAFDFASPRLDRTSNPIPFMNQKGLIMHDHKTKKDVYYFYQSMYRKASDYPMLYIVPSTWVNNDEDAKNASIWAYSNCDSVRLYKGAEKVFLGTRIKNSGPRKDTRFQWDNVEIQADIIAEGWYNGEMVVEDTVLIK
jgi:beta-galactosidase